MGLLESHVGDQVEARSHIQSIEALPRYRSLMPTVHLEEGARAEGNGSEMSMELRTAEAVSERMAGRSFELLFERGAEEEKRAEIEERLRVEKDRSLFMKTHEDHEKERLLEDLRDRVEKVVSLEMERDEMRDKMGRMEALLREDEETTLRRQVWLLQQNEEALAHSFHTLTAQKTLLLDENRVLQQKLRRKSTKLQALRF